MEPKPIAKLANWDVLHAQEAFALVALEDGILILMYLNVNVERKRESI